MKDHIQSLAESAEELGASTVTVVVSHDRLVEVAQAYGAENDPGGRYVIQIREVQVIVEGERTND